MPFEKESYLDPMKWKAPMLFNTACSTSKVGQKAVFTAVFWSADDGGRTSEAVRTLVGSSSIPPTRPTNHFIQVRLSMKFHPHNVWPLL